MHRWERLHLLPPKFFFFFFFLLWRIICGMRWLWFCSLEERKVLKIIFTRRNEKNPFFFFCSHYYHHVKHVISSLSPGHKLIACSKIRRLLMLLQSTFKDLSSSQVNMDFYFCSLLITWGGFAVVLLHLIWVLFSLGLALGQNSPRLHQNCDCSCHSAPKSVRSEQWHISVMAFNPGPSGGSANKMLPTLFWKLLRNSFFP